jgi:hypothetical protein
MCSVLETWREKGKPMFTEQPPNEERDFIHAPYQGPYRAHARIQHERGEVKPDPNAESYVPWADRRKKKR